MTNRTRKIFEGIIIWLALGWTLGGLYYLRQPIQDGEFRYFDHLPVALLGFGVFFGKHFPDFFWVFLLALSGLGISFLILEKGLKLRLPSGFCLGTGLGLLGLVIFLLGELHGLYPNLIRAIILLLAIPGIYLALVKPFSLAKINRASGLEAGIIVCFGIALLMVLVHPTTFYDALSYHFALPRQYLLRNSVAPIPSISYSHFPQIAEMLYLAGLAGTGPVSAQLLNFLFWLAIILLGRELFALLFGTDKKILSTIILLSLPIFPYLGHLVTNDLAAAFFILAGVYLLVRDDLGEPHRSFLFGLAAGLGCSVKLNLYLYLLLPQSLWLAYLLIKSDRKNFLKNSFIAALGFLLICAPFWARNLAVVSNPFFPALAGILGGPLSADQGRAIWNDAHGVTLSLGMLKGLFQIPHELTYVPMSGTQAGAKLHEAPFLGTALAAGLILLVLKKPGRKLLPAILYALAFYLVWAFSFRLSRFALGLWLLLAVLSAGGFSLWMQRGKWQSRGAKMVLAVAIFSGLTLELLAGARETGWLLLIRPESAGQYLRGLSRAPTIQLELGAYPVFDWLNRNSKPDDQVLLLGTTSFFYLERKAVASSFLDWNPLLIAFNLNKSPEEICEILNDEPIAYLVFQPAELARLSQQYPANRLTASGRERMDEFFKSPCLELVMKPDSPLVHLYRIKKMGLP